MYLKQRLWMFWNTIDKDNKNKRDKIELEIDKIIFDGNVHNIIIVFVSYLIDGGWNIIKYKKQSILSLICIIIKLTYLENNNYIYFSVSLY